MWYVGWTWTENMVSLHCKRQYSIIFTSLSRTWRILSRIVTWTEPGFSISPCQCLWCFPNHTMNQPNELFSVHQQICWWVGIIRWEGKHKNMQSVILNTYIYIIYVFEIIYMWYMCMDICTIGMEIRVLWVTDKWSTTELHP